MIAGILSEDSNKNFYEDLCILENKVAGGWSNDFGYVSETDIEEFTLIQEHINRKFNVQCTLMSAEYYWSDYCQSIYQANWLKPYPEGFIAFNEFIQKKYLLP